MINKLQITNFNIEVDAKIYALEVVRNELELSILNALIEGIEISDTQNQFNSIEKQIKDLKDIKLDANIRYNNQFVGNEMSSIKAYSESKMAR